MWNYFQDVKDLYLMPGNAVVEVTEGSWTMNVYQAFRDAPASSGGIVKQGDGLLRLYGENDFSGPMTVEGGGLFLQGDLPLPTAYGGSVSVANNGIIALQRADGAGQLAGLMTVGSVGRIGLFAVNAGDVIDLSGLPGVTLEALETFTFVGTVFPYDNDFNVALSNDFVFAGTLADLPGAPGRITLGEGTPPNRVLTLASSNDISGLVLVEGGILCVQHADALGTGPITLRNGAALCFDSASITTPIAAGIIARITIDSYGCILLAPPCAGLDLNLAGLPGVYVGARPNTLAYAGTLTPDGTTYRFGGGLQSEFSGDRGLEVGGLADSGSVPRGVEVGLPGMVFLQGGNAYSGKTRITNGGIVFLRDDSGLGVPPPAYVADHLTLDGGILRVGNDTSIHIHANRGVTLTPNGGAFHNWGGSAITLWSPLAGAGRLTLTDSGALRLHSSANTFTGDVFFEMDRNGVGYLDIGDGGNFSWASAQPVSGIGNGGWLTLNNNNAESFASPIQGAVGLMKRGSGVMTLTAPGNTYTFGSRVENGTLLIAATGVMPHGAGRGSLHLFDGAALDVNGYAVTLNGVFGAGAIMDGTGLATELVVGDGDASSVFTGALGQQLAYRKIGTGTHADFGSSLILSPAVEGGTLVVGNLLRLQGLPLLTGAGSTLTLKTFNGLPGAFADAPQIGDENWWEHNRMHLDSLHALAAFMDNAPDKLLCDSATLGLYFNYGHQGQFFPGKYADPPTDRFIARWHGKFYAPIDGHYQFATASDDGSVIFIGGQKVVDNVHLQGWGNEHGVPSRRGGSIWLPKGHHDITIGFIESGGGQALTAWGGGVGGGGLAHGAIGILPQMFLDSEEPLTTDGILANTLTAQVAGGAGTWVEKVGLPTLIVASDNAPTFEGMWAVRSGEARVVDGGALGGAGAVVDLGATLTFDLTGDLTYSGNVSGGGTLRHAGEGSLTLTGVNTYTGGTIIDQGVLRVGAGATLGGGALVVNGTLELAFSGVVRQSDVMPVTTVTGGGEIVLLSGTLIADAMPFPIRVAGGASYIAATPNPSEVILQGGSGELGNSSVQMVDLSDPSLWQANGSAGWVSEGVARLTSAPNPHGSGTLILKEPMNVALPWEMSFTYNMAGTTTGEPADGFSWFIHNHPAGANARGGGASDSGVAGIRSAFGFIFQIYHQHNPFFRFCWVEDGHILDHTKVVDLNGVEPRWGETQVHIAHDGAGLVTVTLTQNGNVYTDSYAIDFTAALNGMTGWLGFGGATGGNDADQQISNMRIFTPVPKVTRGTDDWVYNGSARILSEDVVQLTPFSGGIGNMHLKEKLDLSQPWSASFTYYLDNRQHDSADGFSVFLHNDPRGTATTGGGGGGRGHTGISPQVGFTANIFGGNYFAWITNGNEDGGRANNPNGIAPVNGNLRVTMEYDGNGVLRLKVMQGNNSWASTREVDLAAALGAPDAWLGISGATGGVTADQRMTDLSVTRWGSDYLCPAYGTSVSVMEGATGSTLAGGYLPPEVSAGTLTLHHGAELGICPNPLLPMDVGYAVAFQNVVLLGSARVAVMDNGNGAGVLSFGNLHVEAGGTVAFTGNVSCPGNTLTVTAAPDMPRGFHMIADFTHAVGVDTRTTFILDPLNSPPRSKLVFRNGKLYLSLLQGTVMILR